jgi:hypothetical protein
MTVVQSLMNVTMCRQVVAAVAQEPLAPTAELA